MEELSGNKDCDYLEMLMLHFDVYKAVNHDKMWALTSNALGWKEKLTSE